MKRVTPRRLVLAIGWLLTPLAAWAVSFLGGWLAAQVGRGSESDLGGVWWLAGGALLGAAFGAIGWVLLMRVTGRALARRWESL